MCVAHSSHQSSLRGVETESLNSLTVMQAQQDDVGSLDQIVLEQTMLTCTKGGGQVGFCFSGGAGGGVSSLARQCDFGVGFGMDVKVGFWADL
jgi:hypothetical protein